MQRVFFWSIIADNKPSKFKSNLACIAIDKTYLTWRWREFRKKYGNISMLQIIFPNISIVAFLATITWNVLEYICKILHLNIPVYSYKWRLDRLNIIYIVQEIKKDSFGELDILIPPGEISVVDIPKTMIFLNNINVGIVITRYLQCILLDSMQSKKETVIVFFNFNYKTDTRDGFVEDFWSENTCIIVCTDTAGISVDIPDVARAIQWKICDHLVLAFLLQQIGQVECDKILSAMAIMFVESKHFLLEGIAFDENSFFCAYITAIGPRDTQLAEEIISTFYKNNYQMKKKKVPTSYHAVDPAVLWLINIVRCRQYLALACFINNSAFKGQTHSAYCNNCMYSI